MFDDFKLFWRTFVQSSGDSEEQIAHMTMTDERLPALGLLSVDSDLLDNNYLVTLLTPLRLQKAESVCKIKTVNFFGNSKLYEFRTEKSIIKFNPFWVMTER